MDVGRECLEITKMCDDNIHVCKFHLSLVLSLNELDELIEEGTRALG